MATEAELQVNSVPVGPNGWMPINTAPLDGTRVRLGHERAPGFLTKDPHVMGATSGVWDGSRWVLSSFFIVPDGRYGLLTETPTHWMPLPDRGAAA
jgi:hypothetical protein